MEAIKPYNSILEFEIQELAMHLLGIDPDDEEYEEKIETGLYETYAIDPDAFNMLIRQLTPLIDKAQGGMDERSMYKGFAKIERTDEEGNSLKRWLLKIPA